MNVIKLQNINPIYPIPQKPRPINAILNIKESKIRAIERALICSNFIAKFVPTREKDRKKLYKPIKRI